MQIEFKELISDDEWRKACTCLVVLRPLLCANELLEKKSQLTKDGYRLFGIIRNNHIVSVASATISPHPVLGRELLIHDMATIVSEQKMGFGKLILEGLEKFAIDNNCGLDTQRSYKFVNVKHPLLTFCEHPLRLKFHQHQSTESHFELPSPNI